VTRSRGDALHWRFVRHIEAWLASMTDRQIEYAFTDPRQAPAILRPLIAEIAAQSDEQLRPLAGYSPEALAVLRRPAPPEPDAAAQDGADESPP